MIADYTICCFLANDDLERLLADYTSGAELLMYP
jgi:hypothetical protein